MIISEFKAKAIATLKRVNTSGRPLLITIRGEPVAQIQPAGAVAEKRIVLGTGRDLMIERPDDQALVDMGFSDEWELNA